MLSSYSLAFLTLQAGLARACIQLDPVHIHARSNVPRDTGVGSRGWSYDDSFNWGSLKPEWTTCQNGTQQSPIGLTVGSESTTHKPTFKYPDTVTGDFNNWGFGPAFILDKTSSAAASMTFKESNAVETVYLASWHIHAPSDHNFDGKRSRAEMHFVHTDASGKNRAVVGFRINNGPPGYTESAFFKQLPPLIGYNETTKHVTDAKLNLNLALKEVNAYEKYWTYKGSLTTPPCTEGLRWFVSRDVITLSDRQLQALLGAAKYSSRVEQQIWRQDVGV